jgi:hypothetical protein
MRRKTGEQEFRSNLDSSSPNMRRYRTKPPEISSHNTSKMQNPLATVSRAEEEARFKILDKDNNMSVFARRKYTLKEKIFSMKT